jgi:hypothetical protein
MGTVFLQIIVNVVQVTVVTCVIFIHAIIFQIITQVFLMVMEFALELTIVSVIVIIQVLNVNIQIVLENHQPTIVFVLDMDNVQELINVTVFKMPHHLIAHYCIVMEFYQIIQMSARDMVLVIQPVIA